MDFRIESNEREQLEDSVIRQLSTLYKTRRTRNIQAVACKLLL